MHKSLLAYEQAWNTTDTAERRQILAESWVADGIFTSPTVHLEGVEAIALHIDNFRARFPTARISVSKDYREQREVAWVSVRIALPDGSSPTVTDFAQFTHDGRLKRITVFHGPPPSTFE